MQNKQVQIYSVNTKSFYFQEEELIRRTIGKLNGKIKTIQQYRLLEYLDDKKKPDNVFEFIQKKQSDDKFRYYVNKFYKKNKKTVKSKGFKDLLKCNDNYNKYKNELKQQNKLLKGLLESNDLIRELNPDKLSKYNIVAMHDSYLTRTLELEISKLSTDLFIVEIFHYSVFKQLVRNGFTYLGEQYIFFTASAGQIRVKRIVMIKEKVWEQHKNTLMCGLTVEDINNSKFTIDDEEYYGCNINKYLSYLALCTGATEKWDKFDIDKAIVIDDFETLVAGVVDYIDNETFIAERRIMGITITHSDGCGWMLPSVSKKNFMVRLPWVKGLLTSADYLSYCKDYNNGNYEVIDIYGKEWDLLKDDIRYVFFKSQFKMHNYYKSWQDYKDKFKDNKCHASICNIEPNKNDFKNKSVPYQMWQTLTDITDDELECLTDNTFDYLMRACTNRDFMLNILGVNNKNKTYLQQAISIYPEMIKEPHVNQELRSIVNSKKNEAKYGKFEIGDIAKYTFIIPDIFAWMQYSLGGIKNPEGLLKDGEVSCRLYKDEEEISVNRNPHLFKEWAVRKNICDYTNENWFTTNGVYTSCHDLISKLIMHDNDGDTALVIKGKLVEIAKRNMKGIVPLYYKMSVAKPDIINPDNVYFSLTTAFKYSNIGKYSNKLTKIWNSDIKTFDIAEDDKVEKIEVSKAIVAQNNFSIDAAKTLYMPKIQGYMVDIVKLVDKIKMPYFFQFVKKEYKGNVEKINNSTVNRICKKIEAIPQQKYKFDNIGTFRYDNLLRNKKIEINSIVANEYDKLNNEMQKYFFKNKLMTKQEISMIAWDDLRRKFRLFCKAENIKYEDAVDMVIRHIYKTDRDCRKEFLFNVFGDVIVDNLKNNIGTDSMTCSVCTRRTKRTSNRQTMCPSCADKAKKEKDRKRKKKNSAFQNLL